MNKDSKYVKIIVKPNSDKNRILDNDDKDELRVEIAAPAEDNKANIEVIKFFSKLTGKNVRIKTGKTSKRKLLEFY